MSDQQLFQQVLRHFAMGSSMGSIFVTALFALNAREFFDVALNSSAPTTTLIILLLGVSLYFGFGAAITGFVFIVMDEDLRKKPWSVRAKTREQTRQESPGNHLLPEFDALLYAKPKR